MASSGGVRDLLAFQISSWYPAFARVTFKTVILPLPPAVTDWLVSDGLHLAPDSQAFAKRGPLEEYPDEDDYQDWSEGGSEAGGSGSEADAAAQPPPPELEQLKERIQTAIDELGGRAVPKLSWSCPKDAVWMSPSSSLACTNADEVLLLLSASDRVAHDICHALPEAAAAGQAADAADAAGDPAGDSPAAGGGTAAAGAGGAPAAPAVQHCLALRRWYDLQPGREFRCFVRAQALVGASQRDLTQCFEFLKEAEERRELAEAIAAFHAKHIQGRFPLPDFTYDVYVATSGAVRLLDFNPVGGTTAPLLFSWEELGLGSGAGSAAAEAGAEATGGAAAEAGAEAASRAAGAAEQPAAAACCGGTCSGQHEAAAVGRAGVGQAGQPAAEAAAEGQPSYLEQLRRMQALSLSEQQQQDQGRSAAADAAGADQHAAGGADQPAQQQPHDQQQPAQAQQQAEQAPKQPQQAQQQPPDFELRVIEEPVAMRPHTLAYGVPYDFVDSSEGSALERLMAQTQQAGAEELWAALAAQGGSN